MPEALTLNQRIVLASRPVGAPTPENFRLEREALPDLADGQVLLKTLFLSLDPYMRGRMSDAPSYAAPVEIDEVMTGGAVSRVERSLNPKFHEGDLVVGATGWQSHSISDGRNIIPVPSGLPSPSMAMLCGRPDLLSILISTGPADPVALLAVNASWPPGSASICRTPSFSVAVPPPADFTAVASRPASLPGLPATDAT